jgi:phytanoyl-CoA hydroxylase
MHNRLFDFGESSSTLADCPDVIKTPVKDLLTTGIAIISGSLPVGLCDEVRNGFIEFARRNSNICHRYQDKYDHYPRIINLHTAYKPLFELFRHNVAALAVQDYLFGDGTVLYTSLFYERGSSQAIHRDTPYFATRPEYRYRM